MFDTEIMAFDEAWTRYQVEWQALAQRTLTEPSACPEWLSALYGGHGALEELRVWVASHRGTIQAILPFFISPLSALGLTLQALNLGGNRLSYHQTLCAEGEFDAILNAFLRDQRLGRWDVFVAQNVVEGGPLDGAVRSWAHRRIGRLISLSGDESPYLPLTCSWEDYLASRSRSFRYRLRRKARTVQKSGRSEIRWYYNAGQVPELLQSLLRIEQQSRKMLDKTAISQDAKEQSYYEKLLPILAHKQQLFANALYLEEEPLAYSLCYTFNNRIGQLKTSFVQSREDISPGTYVVDTAIQAAFELGYEEFDFLGPNMPHKAEWTRLRRAHKTYFWYGNSWRGRCVGWIKRASRAIRGILASAAPASSNAYVNN